MSLYYDEDVINDNVEKIFESFEYNRPYEMAIELCYGDNLLIEDYNPLLRELREGSDTNVKGPKLNEDDLKSVLKSYNKSLEKAVAAKEKADNEHRSILGKIINTIKKIIHWIATKIKNGAQSVKDLFTSNEEERKIRSIRRELDKSDDYLSRLNS